ncbi:MAG TPA: DUF192 domain-containing protein [Chthonomonadaceae bacterium]|nr:DUF192 domain-containing protein [Chthonomonadaceae bacterium]
MAMVIQQLCEAETRRVVVARLEVAASAWQRAVGLMGRSSLAEDAGLWLQPCNGVHTFFLRFPLDLLILDREGCAVRLVSHLRPWRVFLPVRGGHTTVELPAGTLAAQGLRQGARYVLAPLPNPPPVLGGRE